MGVGGEKAIYHQLNSVFMLPKTQPTQDKLSTKALMLQGSGGQKAILLQLYYVFCFSRRSRRRNRFWEAKQLYKTIHVIAVLLSLFASEDAADAGQTQHQGP